MVLALVRILKCPDSNFGGDNRNVFVSKIKNKIGKSHLFTCYAQV